MAVPGDFRYLAHLIESAVVQGPVLEVGSLDHQGGDAGNARATCRTAGLAWEGADLELGPGVDFQLDILDPTAVQAVDRRWPSVLVFNLLEHVYDPARALAGSMELVEPGGVCVVAGPCVWELHDFPADYWRPMPDFFFEFARRQGYEVVDGTARWIVNDGLIPMAELSDGAQKLLPSKRFARRIYGPARASWSRIVHRGLNTLGRGRFVYPQSGFGICLRKPAG